MCLQEEGIFGDVRVSVQFMNYTNTEGKKWDGTCCDDTGGNCQIDKCDHYFQVCLDDR